MIQELFRAIDEKNPKKFISFLAPDCIFRFGNGPAVEGADNIERYVCGFFDSIDSLMHEITETWDVAEGIVCHGTVTYTRMNGSELTVPFSNVLKTGSDGIDEYLIFADTSQLYS